MVMLSACSTGEPNQDETETSVVPDVIGLHPNTAEAVIGSLGFDTVLDVDAVSFDPEKLEVFATIPATGEKLETGGSVRICSTPTGDGTGQTGQCPVPFPKSDPDVEAEVERTSLESS